MFDVESGDGKAEMQGRGADNKVLDGDRDPFSRLIALDLPSELGNGERQ